MFRHFTQDLRFKKLTEFQGKSIKKKTTPGYIIVKQQKIKDKEQSLMGEVGGVGREVTFIK